MKKTFKKVLSLGLAAAMFVSCTSAGSPTSSQAPTAKPTTNPGTSSAPAATSPATTVPRETIKLTVSMPNFGVDPIGTPVQDEWLKRSEDYLGVNLDIKFETLPLNDYREKEKLVLASNDLPDIFAWTSYNDILNYGGQGTIFDMAPMLERGELPNYAKFVEETPKGKAQVYTVEGNVFGFQSAFYNPNNIEGAQSFSTVAYRFDILKKHNLQPASTIEEFYDLCVKLKELYPDNYIITSQDKGNPIYRGFDGIFHVRDGGGSVFWDGKEFVHGSTTENFKELLTFFNKLWEIGAIDPEFASDDNATVTQKALTGKIFIQPSVWAGSVSHYNRNTTVEGMEWGLTYLPTNKKYGTPWKLMSQEPGRSLSSSMGNAISAKSKYTELCAKLLDYEFSDEIIELIDWGIEGLTYNKVNGENKFLPEIMNATDPVAELGKFGVASSMVCRTGIVFVPQDLVANWQQLLQEPWWHNGNYLMHQYWFATNEYGGKESVAPKDPVIQLTPDEATMVASTKTALKQYMDESAIKFIKGTMDIEKDWDTYVNNLKKVGDFTALVDLYNSKINK